MCRVTTYNNIKARTVFIWILFSLTACIDVPSDNDYELGTFIDSPVVGLDYKTETLEGRTNIGGEFRYLENEKIVFSIGDIQFPEVSAQSVLTPLDLANMTDASSTTLSNMLRLLQTLDKDRNPENNIEIAQEVHKAAEGKKLDFTSTSFASDDSTADFLAEAVGEDVALVSSEVAMAHFSQSIENIMDTAKVDFLAGSLADQTLYVLTGKGKSTGQSSSDLNQLIFSDPNRVVYKTGAETQYGQYEIDRGLLKLMFDDSEATSYVSILAEKDSHLVTCWADSHLGSLLCDKEDEYIRLFSDSTTASYFVQNLQGTSSSTGSGSTDSGSTDSGSTESGSTDAGSTDAGSTDSGSTDSGSTDSGSTDSGSTDSGSTGSGSTDSGSTDSGSTDSGSTDSGSTDSGSTDSGSTDSGSTDSGSTDSGSTDSGSTDEPEIGAASSAEGLITKFNPGHYVFMEISRRYTLEERNKRRIDFIKAHINDPELKGFVGTYDWRYLEPTKNNYNFENIREILKMLEGTGKHFAIFPKDRAFGTNCTKAPVPDYLRSKYSYKSYGYVCMIKIYLPEVMDRQIALYQAIGKEFDDHPNFELITTGETTLKPADGDSSFSHEKWEQQLIRFFNESKKELKHTLIDIQMNFLGGIDHIDDVAAAMAKTGGGALGLPDTVPCRRMDIPESEVCGYRIEAYNILRKYNGTLAITPNIETWDLIYEQTPEIFDMAIDYLGASHVLWQSEFTSRRDSRSYVPNYLNNQVRPTIGSQGGRSNDSCPSALGTCLTN